MDEGEGLQTQSRAGQDILADQHAGLQAQPHVLTRRLGHTDFGSNTVLARHIL